VSRRENSIFGHIGVKIFTPFDKYNGVRMMKNLTASAVALILISSVQSNASELNWSFKSPAFHYGNGYSTHVLSVEQLQHNRKEDQRKDAEAEARRIERELENTILNKFMRNVESRIYAQLSKQMVDNMFKVCDESAEDSTCTTPTGGTTVLEGATITWSKDATTGSITLVVVSDDGTTEITIPGEGEFFF
tara:strand:+ start:321 stop:893 length:573 start_codon:yes stop_codon:yes gene_type:complete